MILKICTIVGTRPQFIKYAPVSQELSNHEELLVHAGQHYDANLSDIFFQELGIRNPDIRLESGSESHGVQTTKILVGAERVLLQHNPDIVMVYGDTNSTLAGALAAAKLNIPVAHVEAGCRSFDRRMPEEVNRVIVDHISTLNFAPDYMAMQNLMCEGSPGECIRMVGDTLADALHMFSERPSVILAALQLKPKQYHLLTVHRQGNTENPDIIRDIFSGVSRSYLPVVFPVHPRTSKAVYVNRIPIPDNIITLLPIGYIDMIHLMRNAKKIITDSGGMQHEAAILGVPCVTLRDTTEWVDTVRRKWNVLAGTNPLNIAKLINSDFTPPQKYPVEYGAAKKIIAYMEEWYDSKR